MASLREAVPREHRIRTLVHHSSAATGNRTGHFRHHRRGKDPPREFLKKESSPSGSEMSSPSSRQRTSTKRTHPHQGFRRSAFAVGTVSRNLIGSPSGRNPLFFGRSASHALCFLDAILHSVRLQTIGRAPRPLVSLPAPSSLHRGSVRLFGIRLPVMSISRRPGGLDFSFDAFFSVSFFTSLRSPFLRVWSYRVASSAGTVFYRRHLSFLSLSGHANPCPPSALRKVP